MAEAKEPSLVKLVVGAIFAGEGILIKATPFLERRFGPIDFQSPSIPFNSTKFYAEEMGPGLLRKFLGFKRLINPQKLAEIKLYTNSLEKRFSLTKEKPSRRINLDPGYICTSKLVLATCKNFAHRIYLDKGIYAEVTLHFQKGTFRARPWTYPDYRSKSYLQCLNAIREMYLQQLPQ